jgi:hypothetical protein
MSELKRLWSVLGKPIDPAKKFLISVDFGGSL